MLSQKKNIAGILGGTTLGDNQPVRIMGVLNLSMDSFYGGSVKRTLESVLSTASKMVRDGADFIDVGARSTAPYKKLDISEETEKKLLTKTVRSLIAAAETDVPISVDTTRYEPAKAAIEEGATILNDVYGFTQKEAPKLAQLVAAKDVSLLTCAHEKETGTTSPFRKEIDPAGRAISCLKWTMKFAKGAGISEDNITIDPGIGFFKDQRISNLEWNCRVISNLSRFRVLGSPIAVGVSRKRFIGTILGRDSPADRLIGSLGATAIAVINGAHLVRTHDVLETRELTTVVSCLREKRFNPRTEQLGSDAKARCSKRG